MKSAEGSGRTVEEAIRQALRTLGARREDVDLIVLDEGNRGVLGLGAREARVKLTLLSEEGEEEAGSAAEPSGQAEAGEPAAVARGVTAALIDAMGFRGTVQAREDAGAVQVIIAGAQLAPLIGRRGQTLEALELLVNLIVARRLSRRIPVVVDAERYRERRREALEALARRSATRVRRMGQPVALEPMSPSERRVIHTTLAASPGVSTHSEGEGASRHVVITLQVPEGAAPRATPDFPEGLPADDAEESDTSEEPPTEDQE